MKALHGVAFVLVLIGGLNWLLVGLFSGLNVVEYLGSTLATIVYILVGLSALYLIFTHKKTCRMCERGGSMPPQM